MVLRLDAGQATKFLVSLLLPLSDQVFISPLLSQTVLVQLSRDLLLFVIQVVDVAGPLMV